MNMSLFNGSPLFREDAPRGLVKGHLRSTSRARLAACHRFNHIVPQPFVCAEKLSAEQVDAVRAAWNVAWNGVSRASYVKAKELRAALTKSLAART